MSLNASINRNDKYACLLTTKPESLLNTDLVFPFPLVTSSFCDVYSICNYYLTIDITDFYVFLIIHTIFYTIFSNNFYITLYILEIQ